jgi:hypothetical protein
MKPTKKVPNLLPGCSNEVIPDAVDHMIGLIDKRMDEMVLESLHQQAEELAKRPPWLREFLQTGRVS